jgi:hypothetical protein
MTKYRRVLCGVLLVALMTVGAVISAAGKVDGAFVVGGTDAKLKYVRAIRTKLDANGRTGVAILLSAREVTGDTEPWRTGDPSKNGSFIYLILEPDGAVWIAELGHASRKDGRFGVVTEVKTSGYKITGDQLSFALSTNGEQEFLKDRFRIDLKIEATIEKSK